MYSVYRQLYDNLCEPCPCVWVHYYMETITFIYFVTFFFCSFLLVYDVVVMLLLFSTLSIHDSILLFTLHIVHCLTMSATVSFLRSIRDVFPSRKSFVFFNSWQLLKAITNNKTQFVCLPFSFHLPHYVIICFILYKLDASLKTYTHTIILFSLQGTKYAN